MKLKCFSLLTNCYTTVYDRNIVPLLRRILNLEELTLSLPVITSRPTYIDGDQLYNEVLKYMSRLNRFIFSIITTVIIMSGQGKMNIQPNEDIRKSFIKRGIQSIDTCADDQPLDRIVKCHVYSQPYQFDEFLYLSNCFQGGKFDYYPCLINVHLSIIYSELFRKLSLSFKR